MARELVVRILVEAKDAQERAKRLADSFKSLTDIVRKAGLVLTGFAAANTLLGRSLFNTAIEAGAGSMALWRFQDASYELKRTLGTLLIEALGPVLEMLASLFRKLNETNPTLLKIAVIAGLVVNAFATIGGPILLLISLIPGLIVGIRILTAAFGALSISMGPVTIAILAIAAGVGAAIFIWRNWETILEGVRSSLSLLDGMLGGVLTRMGLLNKDTDDNSKKALRAGDAFRYFSSGLEITDEEIEQWRQDLRESEHPLDKLIVKVQDATDAVAKFIKDAFKIPQDRAGGILPGLPNLVDLFLDWIDKLRQSDVGQQLGSAIRNIFSGLFGGEVEAGTGMKSEGLFSAIPDQLGDALEDAKKRLMEFIPSIGEQLEELKKLMGQGMTAVGKVVSSVWYKLFGEAETEAGTGKISTGNLQGILANFFQNVENRWQKAKLDWGQIWENFKSMASDKWESIKETIFDKVQAIIDKINSFINFWNNLEFKVPKITVPSWLGGGTYGGFSIGTPNIDPIPGIPGLARGGNLLRGGMALIGERGPELLNLPSGAQVAPLGRGGEIHLHFSNNQFFGFLDFENQVGEAVRNIALTGGFRGVI